MRLSENEYTCRPCDDRLTGADGIEMVRDVELGYRASERMDFLEDETDIRYWADLAVTETMNRGANR